MPEEKIHVRLTKWTSKFPDRSFIVLWDDYTWDEFPIVSGPKHEHIDYKKFMSLGTLTSRRMTKEEALDYIYWKLIDLKS